MHTLHTYLNEIRVLLITQRDDTVDISFHLESIALIGRRGVPFRKTGLALLILEHKKADLQYNEEAMNETPKQRWVAQQSNELH